MFGRLSFLCPFFFFFSCELDATRWKGDSGQRLLMYAAGAAGIWSKSVDGGQKLRGTRPWRTAPASSTLCSKRVATHVDAKGPVNKLDVAERHVCKQSCDTFLGSCEQPGVRPVQAKQACSGQGKETTVRSRVGDLRGRRKD